MGGSGFISYYLLKLLKPGIDPLSADNVLVFACSVVLGSPISGFNRYSVGAKSPLTGAFGEAEAGGYWGPELKFAGFDAIVIHGKADKPVYLYIHDGEVEIRDAQNIWGRDNLETLEQLKEELEDKRVRVVSIGPAGENLVPFACVQNDLEHYNGRTGMGAVMGSKNLKAIAVRGKQKIEPADKAKVKEISAWHRDQIKTHPPNMGLRKFGTPGHIKPTNDAGILPTRNFREGVFEGAEKLAADVYHDTIFHSEGTCWSCSVRCKRRVALEDKKYPLDKRLGGPEYEALTGVGTNVGVDNLPAVARANQLCNLLGLDVISTGTVISFAMECYENNILTDADTDGLSLNFGNEDAMLQLIEDITYKRGLGKILSLGVKRAAEKIGKGAEKFAFHIKGQEMAFHDGRGKTGVALGFALSPTGADHIEAPHEIPFQADGVARINPLGILDPIEPLKLDAAKVRFFREAQRVFSLNNVLGLCNYTSTSIFPMTFHRLVETINAITGWETSLHELFKASERSQVMARIFNNREGFTPKDDRVIRRWFEKMPNGPLKGKALDPEEFRKAIDLYYDMSGWDEKGQPRYGKLVELNLEWLHSAEDK